MTAPSATPAANAIGVHHGQALFFDSAVVRAPVDSKALCLRDHATREKQRHEYSSLE